MERRKQKNKPASKHKILFVPHSLNRIWRNLLLLDIVLWAVWWIAPYGHSILRPPNDIFLIYAGLLVLVLMVIMFLIRNQGYVQAHDEFIKIVLPWYRLQIPYDDVSTVRMTEFKKLFTYKDLNWSDKRFLRPYFKSTVTTLHLKKYPKPFGNLKAFFPHYFFIPKDVGFLFLVKDFMMLTTEIDSRMNAYKDVHISVPTLQEEAEEKKGLLDFYGRG